MEYFFLILFALMVFFWLLKKESQRVEKQNLEQIKFLYEKNNDVIKILQVQDELNKFYDTANKELKILNDEVKGLQNLNKILSSELSNLKETFDIMPMPDGKPHENKFVWTWDKFLNTTKPEQPKKRGEHLKVIKLKKGKGKKNDGNNNKDNN
jgi:hypothetical protein